MPKVPKIEKMNLTVDGRRPFARPTWPAKDAMPFGQVRWAAPGEVPRKVRFVFIAPRLHILAPQVAELKT